MKDMKGEDKVLTWSDTRNMEMTTRVIHETMRIASVISYTFREAVEDVEYEGCYIGLYNSEHDTHIYTYI